MVNILWTIFWSKNKLLSHFIGVPYDGEKADVWSMGVVLYTMVTGRMPFDDSDMKMLVQQIKRGVTFHNPKQPVSESCKDLIRNMLKLDFKTRLSVEEIEAHPWLTNASLSREERAMSEPLVHAESSSSASRTLSWFEEFICWLGEPHEVSKLNLQVTGNVSSSR